MIDKLKENYENLGVNNEKQEKRVVALESKVTQLVITYVFYQGIIFICISQSSNLRCDNWWLPFSLSLFPAVIFFVSFLSSITRYLRTRYYHDFNLLETEVLHYQIFSARSHAVDIECADKEKVHPSGSTRQLLKLDSVKLFRRKACVHLVFVALLSFTAVILAACRNIPCQQLLATPF